MSSASISGSLQQFTNNMPPQMQQAVQAIMSGQMGQYLADTAKQWQGTGAKQEGSDISGSHYMTGGLNASYDSSLNKFAPEKKKEAFDPGVSTRRTV